jgi:hypothetical protein
MEAIAMLELESIRALAGAAYEMQLRQDGQLLTVKCTVTDSNGVRVVSPEPDVFMNSGLSPRALAAAVLAFHDARTSGV